MSVLIENMEMPHGCCECRMERENCCTLSLRRINDVYDRPEWCLLTEAEPVKRGLWGAVEEAYFRGYEDGKDAGYTEGLKEGKRR